jgi:hypothetical protein
VVLPTAVAGAGTLLVAGLPIILGSRPAPRWLSALATGVREAEQTAFNRPPSWRLVGALGYLGFDVAVLWVVLNALGPTPSVAVVILAYSIGYAANSLPIPGGIGVLDAGLTGALVLYGISPVHAAAAVIVYHAIAFRVPGWAAYSPTCACDLGSSAPPVMTQPSLQLRNRLPPRRRHTMTALALMLKPINHGWAVTLTDGRELVRFIGLGAKRRALRYLAHLA